MKRLAFESLDPYSLNTACYSINLVQSNFIVRFNLFGFSELIGALVFENYGAFTFWLCVTGYILDGFRGRHAGSRNQQRGAEWRTDGKLSAILLSQ